MKSRPGWLLYGGAVLAVLGALVAGMYTLGSPKEERARRIDERRVADLQGITAATDLFWSRNSELPASMEELTAEPGVSISTADPLTAEAYGYQSLDSIRYGVCATFEGKSEEMSLKPSEDLWAHGPGRQCFQLKAEEVTRKER